MEIVEECIRRGELYKMPTIRHLTIGLFLVFFLALTGCLPQLTEDQRQTLSSLRRVDDYPLYVMNYYGDYHFDDFMKKGEKTSRMDARYDRIYRTMTERGAKLSEDESMKLLRKVSVNDTTWSTVYNLVSGDLQVAMGGKYDRVYRFKLRMKKGISKGQ